MKTELTKAIERSLSSYHPSEMCGIAINKHRGQHTAFEVPVECGVTTSGLIDCVRVSEYFGDIEHRRVCVCRSWKKDGIRRVAIRCPRGMLDSDHAPDLCDEASCSLNAWSSIGVPKILIVCFEIKVTKADFSSKNGHNFVGNLNYYVVPRDLYSDIKDLVPEGIGIIAYLDTERFRGLRKKKECVYRGLTDEDQKWMILSVLKRIRGMDWEQQYAHDQQEDIQVWEG